jgi:hypothetical protein
MALETDPRQKATGETLSAATTKAHETRKLLFVVFLCFWWQ